MSVIVTRAGKGAPLSWVEADANFTNLNNDKLETSTAATTYTTKVDPATSGTLTHSGDIVLSGTGKRITGDFSNDTVANRVMFQTSTPNASTFIHAVPSSDGWGAGFLASNVTPGRAGSTIDVIVGANEGTAAVIRSSNINGGMYLPMLFYTGGYERMRIDTSGNILATSPAGLGYGPGAGGTVTQATSKSTAVTLNKPCGQITTHNESLANGTEVSFAVNNWVFTLNSVVVLNIQHPSASLVVAAKPVSDGQFKISLRNLTGAAFSEAIVINFAIIKGATS